MELERAVHELEILRAEELRANQGEESPLTEALRVTLFKLHLDVYDGLIWEFVGDRCQLEAGRTVEVGELYREWASWVTDKGRQPNTVQVFEWRLHVVFQSVEIQPEMVGGLPRVCYGIGLLGRVAA